MARRHPGALPEMAHLLRRLLLTCLFAAAPAAAAAHSFGVLPQRSAVLTAQYWNPILAYAERRSGVPLRLEIARSGSESGAEVARGRYDFVYSNHIFQPGRAGQYRVILRPRTRAIAGQIVTLADSPLRRLEDLRGQDVGFPSRSAFVAYALPMDQLRRRGIAVQAMFGGNQEGIMAQLKAGKVAAAGVNDQVMRAFALRENLSYRVLWESEPYQDIPVAVHRRVPEAAARAVQRALAGMAEDPEGARLLAASARIVSQPPPLGFLPAGPADYRNYEDFYRRTVLDRELP